MAKKATMYAAGYGSDNLPVRSIIEHVETPEAHIFRNRPRWDMPLPGNIAEDDLVKRSTKGSRPFSAEEMRQGYRRL